jgi:hypothetical protein
MRTSKIGLTLLCVASLLGGAASCFALSAPENFAASADVPVFISVLSEEYAGVIGTDSFSSPELRGYDILPDIALEEPFSIISRLSLELVERCL